MNILQLQTPALILDKKALEYNVSYMDRLLRESGLHLRPHYKSHRCIALAKMQIEHGAVGMTCSKLGEAIDLVENGILDILIANQITQPEKIAQVAALAGKCHLAICVDDHQNIDDLEEAARRAGTRIYIFVEYETGMDRCGVSDFDEFLRLAGHVTKCPHLIFQGIQAYAGHLSHETDQARRKAASAAVEDKLLQLKKYLENHKIPVKDVSSCSTGTIELRKDMPGVYTEIQAGSYLFMDASYRTLGLDFKHSLYVLSSVISRKNDKFVTDAGVKTCSVDQGDPLLLEDTDPALHPLAMNEEHIVHHWKDHPFQINQFLHYIPGHCCATINMYDKIYVYEDSQITDCFAVTSRGKSF